MPKQALFAGLVVDEFDRSVETAYVGDEPCYVVDDAGFRRHIPSEQVDRQVLKMMSEQIEGHEDLLAEQAGKMLGQDDIFTRAALEQQFKNIDQQLEQVLQTGIPESGRAYMGMLGFKIVINVHGEVIDLNQPGIASDEGE
ncbi:MAG: hypothetical protein AB1846_10050 [Chloroflexota bacterium]